MLIQDDVKETDLIQIQEGFKFTDFLTDEQRDQLLDLAGVTKKRKPTPLYAALGRKEFIPLSVVQSGKNTRGLSVVWHGKGSTRKYLEALLWTAVFGNRYFTVLHWNILFGLFQKTISKSKQSEALLKILRITTAKEQGYKWTNFLKPVRTVLRQELSAEETQTYLERLQQDLGIKLPSENPLLGNNLKISLKFRPEPKALEPNKVGVGYKDKGHLPDPSSSREEPEGSLDYEFPEDDIFVDLMHRTEECQIFSNSYNPKKKVKLLNQLKTNLKS
jgi:hypothetical protein